MDEREAFEIWFNERFQDLDVSEIPSHEFTKAKSNMFYGWQAALAHRKNESVAEALEKALAIALNYTEHGHERRKITSEIRALIKEGE